MMDILSEKTLTRMEGLSNNDEIQDAIAQVAKPVLEMNELELQIRSCTLLVLFSDKLLPETSEIICKEFIDVCSAILDSAKTFNGNPPISDVWVNYNHSKNISVIAEHLVGLTKSEVCSEQQSRVLDYILASISNHDTT